MSDLENTQRILLPTAFSRAARGILAYAHRWCSSASGQVSILHVVRWPRYISPDLLIRTTKDESVPAKAYVQKELKEKFNDLTIQLSAPEKARTKSVTAHGRIVGQILEHSQQADLLVLDKGAPHPPASPSSGIITQILGDVATPTLVVHEARPWPIKRILVATLGSDDLPCELRAGNQLARRFGASLDLLKIVKPVPFLQGLLVNANGGGDVAYEDWTIRAAESVLDEWRVEHPEIKIHHTTVCVGDPLETIQESLSTRPADLLILGGRSPSSPEFGLAVRLWIRALRALSLPTLFVPLPGHETAIPREKPDKPKVAEEALNVAG